MTRRKKKIGYSLLGYQFPTSTAEESVGNYLVAPPSDVVKHDESVVSLVEEPVI